MKRAASVGVVLLLLGVRLGVAAATALPEPPRPSLAGPLGFEVNSVPYDNGRHIKITWIPGLHAGAPHLLFRTASTTAPPPSRTAGKFVVAEGGTLPKDDSGEVRADWSARGEWTFLGAVDNADYFIDTVPAQEPYRYAIMVARPGAAENEFTGLSHPLVSAAVAPEMSWFNLRRLFFLSLVLAMAGALYFYTGRAKKHPEDIYIRRIPGVDAIEESVGRSTEMGRPVLYVTGVEEIQNIQTIASLLILGHVSEMIADYDTEMKVANFFPLTMVVAEEIVKQGFANAGRLDAHKPENVMFISAEQFAFAAGVNGLILRDKPATNIYLGRFFAESLMLAETGYVTKAVQIAGTAEITQLPFFIAACDYTIIGEELYAVSAYLSREPSLLATLKATDMVKLLIMVLIVVGALGATFSSHDLGPWLLP